MYPNHYDNQYTVGDAEHRYMEEIVSPISPESRAKSAWDADVWTSDRYPQEASFDNEAYERSSSPYAAEDFEYRPDAVHFNRVDWEHSQRHELDAHTELDPRSTFSSAEEFRLPNSRSPDDGLGIHIIDAERQVRFLSESLACAGS